jgi:hypothetical protein
MSEQPAIDTLVTDTATSAPPPPAVATEQTHDFKNPAAKIDPAAALDPAKAELKVKPPRKRARKPTKRAAAKRDAAATAASVATMARGRARKAAASDRAASDTEARAAYEAAIEHRRSRYGDLPEGASLHLRFANGDEFVTEAVPVEADALTIDGEGKTSRALYQRPSDFVPEAPPATITEAWLIADSGEAVCCEVGIGLVTGGGKHALVPAGHLLF